MEKKLSKNFDFLYNDKLIEPNLEPETRKEIISYILKGESFENIDWCIKWISDALCLILKFYVSKNNLVSTGNELNDLIYTICQNTDIKGISKFVVNAMTEIRHSRNYVMHRVQDKVDYQYDNIEVINKLNRLFIIIKTLFPNWVTKNLDFDKSCYKQFDLDDISAISKTQRIEDNKDASKVTTDLIINMDSLISWLSIKDSKLVIPIYQRRYEWKKENIDALFEDILLRIADNSDHYFGTIAQKKKFSNNLIDTPHQIKIIDGQQRLTTSLLIVAATRQIFLERGYVGTIEEIDWYSKIIKNHFHKNKGILSKYINNPGVSFEENSTFETILDNDTFFGSKTKFQLKNKQSNFYINYNYIIEKINEHFKTKEELISFINTFLNNFKVASVNFDFITFTNKDEMDIFENLNSKGVDLSIQDLIKNHLFNFCDDELLNRDEFNIAGKYNSMLLAVEISEDKLEEFYSLLTEFIKGSELTKDKSRRFILIKNAINELLADYTQITNDKEYEAMLGLLKTYMYLFSEAKKQEGKFIEFIKVDKIMKIISVPKKKNLFSYFLFIIYRMIDLKYKNNFNWMLNDQDFKLVSKEIDAIQKLFMEVTKFLVRTQIITGQGESGIRRDLFGIASKYYKLDSYENKTIEQLCDDIIYDIQKCADKHYPYEIFKQKLISNNDLNGMQSLLLLVESIMCETYNYLGEQISRSNSSIEHIMPQDLSEWTQNMTLEEKTSYEEKANSSKEKIGNYLLLSIGKNSKARNYPFDRKQNEIYKTLVSPLYKNEDSRIDVSRKNNWDFEAIEARTTALIEFITKHVIVS